MTEWEWPRTRVDIVVERDSQKGMVIGKGGQILKQVGELAPCRRCPPGVYLELRVKVDKDWQRRPERVERLGVLSRWSDDQPGTVVTVVTVGAAGAAGSGTAGSGTVSAGTVVVVDVVGADVVRSTA